METSNETLTKILSKPSAVRTAEDIKKISNYMYDIKFFASIRDNKTVFQECCLYITCEHFNQDRFVFKIGDYGDKFFILVDGQVSILVPIGSSEQHLKEIMVLKSGSSFGDLALIEDKPRSATVLTKTECYFAVLTKNDYQRILANIMKNQKLDLVNFLQVQPMFKNFTKGSLKKMSYCFEELRYTKEQVVYEEGAKIDFLFLIKEGEIKISKKFGMTKVEFDSWGKYKDLLNKKFSQNAQISVQGQGEFLGIYEIDKGVYENSAVCKSKTAVLLKLSIGDFNRRLNFKEVKSSISQSKSLKQAIHESYINSITKVIKEKESSLYRRINLSLSPTSKLKNLAENVRSVDSPVIPSGLKTIETLSRQKIKNPGSSINQYVIKIKRSETRPVSIMKNKKDWSYGPSNTTDIITKLNPFGEKKPFKPRKRSVFLNIHKASMNFKHFQALKFFTKTEQSSHNH